LFTTPAAPGSIIDYVRNAVTQLTTIDATIEIVLFVSRENRVLYEDLRGARVRLVEAGRSNERLVWRIASQQLLLPVIAAREGIDVFFAPAEVAPLLVRCPVVLKVNTFHHYYEPWALGAPRRWYRRVMIRVSAWRARVLIANSEDTRSDILRFLRVPPDRVVLSYEAVDDAFSVVSEQPIADIRRRLRLQQPYVLFLSTLYPYKNLATLLAAFAQIAARGSFDGVLAVAGPDYDGERARMEALAQELGCADRVVFLGALPNKEVPALLAGAIVMVYPSLRETFGKPLVEAMKCGVPIIAANRGAIPEIVKDAAILIEPTDTTALRNAIERVIASPDLRAELVRRGRDRAEFFSWARAAGELVAAFQSAVESPSVHDRVGPLRLS
jgi:glycosyltransferase involved in cell wall biosynthesis